MLGYEVVRILEQNKDVYTNERWVAPALDCYPLQDVFRRHDGRHQDVTATAVQEEEPPTSMFETPLGYVERSPKHIQAQYAQEIPGGEFLPKDVLQLAEGRYQAAQRKRQ